jgi:hypothetical protein
MLLTLIKSCAKHSARRAACRATWLQSPLYRNWWDYRFVTGPGVNESNVLSFQEPDDFKSIAPKLCRAFEFAIRNGYTNALVLDDDTYVRPERIDTSGWELVDYMGYLRIGKLAYNNDVPYAQGSAYVISARGMGFAIRSGLMVPNVIDDGALGRALIDKVHFVHNNNFEVGPNRDRLPLAGNNILTTHKCLPGVMEQVHAAWERSGAEKL